VGLVSPKDLVTLLLSRRHFTTWEERTDAPSVGHRHCRSRAAGFDDSTGKKSWGYTKESASRIIPDVTAVFHGIVYAQAEVQPVLMDATTGDDVKSDPSAGPTEAPASQGADPAAANGSDMSQYDGKMRSPVAVTQYGATYLQDSSEYNCYSILIALTPTA
jgi:hypothetical protein